jgi:hypothetical protein
MIIVINKYGYYKRFTRMGGCKFSDMRRRMTGSKIILGLSNLQAKYTKDGLL